MRSYSHREMKALGYSDRPHTKPDNTALNSINQGSQSKQGIRVTAVFCSPAI